MKVAGLISVQLDGEVMSAKGEFEVTLGKPKREMVEGADGIHGHTEKAIPSRIAGKITDRLDLDLSKVCDADDAVLTLKAGNGKIFSQRNAVYCGDGKITTKEAEFDFDFQSPDKIEEIR